MRNYIVLGLVASLVVACGTADDSSVFVPAESRLPTSFGGSSGNTASGGFGIPDSGPPVDPTCAAVASETALIPVNLVVLLDRSGSMGDTAEDPSFDPKQRWVPVTDAMKAFFEEPTSAGIRASLTFFPDNANACTATDYAKASVPMTALPSSALSTVINATAPKGDTPTRGAIGGAIAQAEAEALARPGERTAIVVATDGQPYGCGVTSPSDEVAVVASQVGAVASRIPTYVVGVGPSVDLLKQVATAGGTTEIPVTVGKPEETKAQLLKALQAVRGTLASCELKMPKPSDGRQVDVNKVSVEVARDGAPPAGITYSADCADPAGWHFDNLAAPTQVVLCKSSCDLVRSQGGKANVKFQCVVQQNVR
jgi:von Willebrand factor type A domain